LEKRSVEVVAPEGLKTSTKCSNKGEYSDFMFYMTSIPTLLDWLGVSQMLTILLCLLYRSPNRLEMKGNV